MKRSLSIGEPVYQTLLCSRYLSGLKPYTSTYKEVDPSIDLIPEVSQESDLNNVVVLSAAQKSYVWKLSFALKSKIKVSSRFVPKTGEPLQSYLDMKCISLYNLGTNAV